MWEPGQAGGRFRTRTTLQAVGKAAGRTMDGVGPGSRVPGLRRAHGAWAGAHREDPAQAQQTGGPVPHARWHACSGTHGTSRVLLTSVQDLGPRGSREAPSAGGIRTQHPGGRAGRANAPRRGMGALLSRASSNSVQLPVYTLVSPANKARKESASTCSWEPQLCLSSVRSFRFCPERPLPSCPASCPAIL